MKNDLVKKMTLAAMFMAIGMLLPIVTMNIPEIGNMLLPMHIPVLLCGLICGWKYGLAVGLILPIFRSYTFGMPPIVPIAFAMSFELATYGFLAGFLYARSRWQCVVALYRVLIISMVGGRVVWGLAMMLILTLNQGVFTWAAFMSGAILMAVPGIIIQLTVIPAIMVALNRTGLVKFQRVKPLEVVSATGFSSVNLDTEQDDE
ncbi:MAG: ECF transporter S component [Lachnospiraceae bacterium]|nr:ECF transporter S component [Lachnospiraceae bacterium]